MAQGQTVGNAAKVAVDLVKAAKELNCNVSDLLPMYEEAVTAVIKVSEQHMDAGSAPFTPQVPSPEQATQNVQSAFPGSTITAPPSQQQNVVPFPQQNSPFGGGGAPSIPGQQPQGNKAEQLEQAWRQFFADIQNGVVQDNWHDNRSDKRTQSSPDFRHKSWKFNPNDKYTVSLWIQNGKTPNPDWVPAQLQQYGLA